MGFFNKIKSSIYNPDFYSKIKNEGIWGALKYFFLLVLIITVINTLILARELLVTVPTEIRNFVNQTVSSYPADLEVKLEGGQVSTNAQEPFFVPIPQDEEYSGINNILVIDTKTPYSAVQFEQYKTLAWLTRDTLFFQNDDFDQRSIVLTDVDNLTVNKSFVEEIASKISPWVNMSGPILVAIVFLGMFIGFSFNLTYFLFLAIFIFILSSIFKWGLNYSASYKTAIYASTLSFIVDLILFNTGVYTGFFGFPFLFTLIALCVTTINLQSLKEKS